MNVGGPVCRVVVTPSDAYKGVPEVVVTAGRKSDEPIVLLMVKTT